MCDDDHIHYGMNARRRRRIPFAMRLVLAVPQFAYPLTGGVGPHARKLAEALADDGDRVLVVSDGILDPAVAYEVAEVGVAWTIAAVWRAVTAVRGFKPDAVLFEYTTFNFGGKSVAPLLMALSFRLLGIRQAAYVHEIFYPASSAAVRSPFRAAIFAMRDAAFVLLAGRVFVANEGKRQRFLRIARFVRPSAVSVVPIGANIEPNKDETWESSRSDGRTVLAFGVVMPRRRFELIIDAVAQLVATGHDLRLRLVGNIFDREYAERCRAYAKSRGVEDRIEMTGALADHDVTAAFQNAAVFAYALEDGLISSSGTLLAALAHGIPIVSATTLSDEPDLRDCVSATAPSGDAIADGLRRLLGDPEEQQRLGRMGTATYDRRFRWSAIAAQLRSALA